MLMILLLLLELLLSKVVIPRRDVPMLATLLLLLDEDDGFVTKTIINFSGVKLLDELKFPSVGESTPLLINPNANQSLPKFALKSVVALSVKLIILFPTFVKS
jgi:hypothetical protein